MFISWSIGEIYDYCGSGQVVYADVTFSNNLKIKKTK